MQREVGCLYVAREMRFQGKRSWTCVAAWKHSQVECMKKMLDTSIELDTLLE